MTKEWPERLVLIGAGKMGGAMAAGWLDGGLPAIVADDRRTEPLGRRSSALAASRGVALNPAEPRRRTCLRSRSSRRRSTPSRPGSPALAGERTLVLSILAGKTIANLKARLPRARAVVRAMPNTPAAIGRGVDRRLREPRGHPRAARLDRAPARAPSAPFHWLDDEAAIDAVTAISGGGPAYVFALTEALAAAAERLGLPAELAMSLARGTVEGAGELMRREPATPPSVLRRNVTSPGGTTAAALAVLQGEGGLDDLMARATAAARARAVEMAG